MAQLKPQLGSILASIYDLKKFVTENSYFLPSYEVCSSLKEIFDLKQSLKDLSSGTQKEILIHWFQNGGRKTERSWENGFCSSRFTWVSKQNRRSFGEKLEVAVYSLQHLNFYLFFPFWATPGHLRFMSLSFICACFSTKPSRKLTSRRCYCEIYEVVVWLDNLTCSSRHQELKPISPSQVFFHVASCLRYIILGIYTRSMYLKVKTYKRIKRHCKN